MNLRSSMAQGHGAVPVKALLLTGRSIVVAFLIVTVAMASTPSPSMAAGFLKLAFIRNHTTRQTSKGSTSMKDSLSFVPRQPSSLGNSKSRENLIPPPPAISMPVWSLATPGIAADPIGDTDEDGKSDTETSMNIVTFTTPVSVAPSPYKQVIVSLYHGTRTKDQFLRHGQGVLQLLRPQHKNLVSSLGKRSGYEVGYSKQEACAQLNYPWVTSQFGSTSIAENSRASIEILPDCALYLHLTVDEKAPVWDVGDHVVVYCHQTAVGFWDAASQNVAAASSDDPPQPPMGPTSVLYTGQLRGEGLL